jgi:inorganic pyrophosphatase
MKMIDDGEQDDKIIAVPVDDPRFDEVQNLGDINTHTLKEIQHFFETYKKVQNKSVEVPGFEDIDSAKEAFASSIIAYNEDKEKNA